MRPSRPTRPSRTSRSSRGGAARPHRAPAVRSALLAALAVLVTLLGPAASLARAQVALGSGITAWRNIEVVPDELIVRFAPGADPAQRDAVNARLGAAAITSLDEQFVRVALPAGSDIDTFIGRYATDASVLFAQPNVLYRPLCPPAPLGIPNDLKWAQQWGLAVVRASDAWDVASGDSAVVIAVLDSGIDADHPDLAAKLAWQLDTASMDADADDQTGHGTHCAGIAAAETNNVVGVAGASGACRVAAYRCGDQTFSTAALVLAIHDAVDRGAQVLSMSWGSTFNDTAVSAALQDALAHGCVLVAAAGNNGDAVPFYPAAHAFVIGVAASNSVDARASFSNYGAWVDLAAPGQSITSTWMGGVYKYASGTSMACPLVAGTAALLYAELGGQRTPAAAAAIRAALQDSAVPVGSWVAHGRLDARAAVDALAPAAPPVLTDILPAQLSVLGGPVTLRGSGLSHVTKVAVDGVAVAAFSAPDDATLDFDAPAAGALGSASVSVLSSTGEAAAIDLDYVEAEPPVLLAPSEVAAGDDMQWSFAGSLGQGWMLLISLDPATFVYGGYPILAHLFVLDAGSLAGLGAEQRSAIVPPAAVGLSLHSQVVTFAGGFHAATAVVGTTITP